MKKLIVWLFASMALVSGAVQAAGGGVAWDKFPKERVTDLAALQNGAKLFTNYCLNCHAAAFIRYNRLRDIGLTEDQIKKNLMFATDRVGDTMTVPVNPREAKEWFGGVPPDLTLITRSRSAAGMGSGADYVYTYLRTYYRDPSKATGWNNLAFPSVGMPHVLWELQGERLPVFEKRVEHGHETEVFTGNWQVVKAGTLDARAYDSQVADLVAFLQWAGEPNQGDRVRLGVWVLLFLLVFTIFAWRLNAAYWKDVK